MTRRTAMSEQSQDGPPDYLVTITGGNCNYVSISDGVGGFTWQADGDTCLSGCGTCPTVDADFLTDNGTPTSAGERLSVGCVDCTGPRWHGKVEVPDGDGLRTSTSRTIYNIQRGSATDPEVGDKVWVRQYLGQWVIVGSAAVDSGGSSGGGCGCCDCLDCVESADAEVDDCAECTNGAMTRYSIPLGTWAEWPELGGTVIVTQESGTCVWKSRLLAVRDPVSGCRGWYQYTLTQDGIDSSLTLAWVSGEDPLELDTAVHVVEWRAVAPWSCLCSSKMQAVNGELFPSPSGLNCQICVVPYSENHYCGSGSNADAYLVTGTFAYESRGFRTAFTVTEMRLGLHNLGLTECGGWLNYDPGGIPSDLGNYILVCDGALLATKIACCGNGDSYLDIRLSYAGGSVLSGISRARYVPDRAVAGQWNLLSVTEDATAGSETISEYPDNLMIQHGDDGTFAGTVTAACEPDDCCDGDCTYTSISDGSGGFTWQSASDTCTGGCAACPTVDGAFLTEHGTPTGLGETLTVACAA